MNHETQKKFAEILAKAQAGAAQKTVLKSSSKKPEKEAIKAPELSNLTIEDILQDVPQPEPETKSPLQLIDYSEKAFAIIGETKPIKEQLKQLGGKYNAFLKCGPCWIFSKKKIDEVKKALNL